MNITFKNSKPPFFMVAAIILALIFFSNIAPAAAQKSLESGGAAKNATGSRMPDGVIEPKIEQLLRDYFENVFAKNYEEAVKSMPSGARGEAAIDRIEKWRESFMSPADLKILNSRDNGDGTHTATVTFSYTNANGVKDIMREKIILTSSGGGYTIKSQPSLERALKTAASASSGAAGFTPVTMTPNAPGGGMPDLSGVLKAFSGGGGAGAANIDPGELLGLMTELVNDPDVMALSANPKIMAIASDPSIMSTLLSGNMHAIEANPKIKELLLDPAIKKIIEKVSSNRSGGNSSGENSKNTPPSSIDGINVDEIFD